LNAIASQIPAAQRVITIEETKELALERHLEDCIALEGRFANLEGVGEIRIRELVRQALRMRPTRIIVGEVRGPEALDMLNAMNSGHEGSMGTIHANSARQALTKLHTYTKMAEEALSDAVVADMLAQTIDLVCQLRLGPDGRRVLTEIVEVAGVEAAAADQLPGAAEPGRHPHRDWTATPSRRAAPGGRLDAAQPAG
jgi:pilus assembly protein CpaF